MDIIQNQINIWRNWVERNKSIFKRISNFFVNFDKILTVVQREAVDILRKYKWFITPSFTLTFVIALIELKMAGQLNSKTINNLFIRYFAENNWHNLESMIKDWERNSLFKKRMKIFLDCLKILRYDSQRRINISNAILPTLIAQIDGILTDYLNSKNISWQCTYDDYMREGIAKKHGRKSEFLKSKPRALSATFDEIAIDMILNILFQKSQPGKPLDTPFNFNRHKIMHGEFVKYGRKAYLIRAFMVLDFLANLK